MSAARLATLLVVLGALAAPAPPAALAARAPSCPPRAIATCFGVTVPIDRAGAGPGTVRIRAAHVRRRRTSRPPLFALTGGPGQAGVIYAETYDLLLPGDRDLVVFDQRGTGASGLLRCRGFERRLRASLPTRAGACGRSLGARRPFYTSADSAQDLEALRVRIGAPRIALYGVSYGTRVALEYARRHPERVERMVLDSPLGPSAPDPLVRETLAAVPRVLRSACRGGRCGRAGAHPVADLARLRLRLRRAPIGGIDADDLLSMLVGADLEPELMRALPRAVSAALRGDSRRLVRLRRVLLELDETGPVSAFSPALFAATTCEESPPAWDPVAAPAERRRQATAVAAATPEQAFHPFDRRSALRGGLLSLCGDWPAPARAIVPAPPLPAAVPALILSGELDLRTPLEQARALAAALPQARLVVGRGIGHAVLGADPSGCADAAVRAFLAQRSPSRCRRGEASIAIAPAEATIRRAVRRGVRDRRRPRQNPGSGPRGREPSAASAGSP